MTNKRQELQNWRWCTQAPPIGGQTEKVRTEGQAGPAGRSGPRGPLDPLYGTIIVHSEIPRINLDCHNARARPTHYIDQTLSQFHNTETHTLRTAPCLYAKLRNRTTHILLIHSQKRIASENCSSASLSLCSRQRGTLALVVV